MPTAGRELHADLGYPRLRIAIDYEGAYHFENGTEQARRDVERYEAMVAAGWRVLRVTALDLRDPSSFLKRLADAIAEASSALFSRQERWPHASWSAGWSYWSESSLASEFGSEMASSTHQLPAICDPNFEERGSP